MRRGVLSMVVAMTVVGCQRDPRCRGELSHEEIERLRDLTARGAAPCPELRDPTIQLGSKGITLSGQSIGSREDVPHDGFPRPIGVLHTALAQNRETWTRVHRGRRFEGRASISISPESDFIAGASTILSAVSAGYPRVRIEAGGAPVEATFQTAEARPGSRELTRDLYIERKSDGKHSAELKEGKVVVTYLENPAGLDGVTSWVGQTCDASRCDVIELNLPGEFQLTADLLRRLLDLESLKKRPLTIRFKAG